MSKIIVEKIYNKTNNMANQEVFQFIQFKSFVHASFWHKLAQVKLNIDKLSDSPKSIFGYYSNLGSRNTACLMEIDCTAFNREYKPPCNSFTCHGVLLNKNTVEDFKICNKNELMKEQSKIYWSSLLEPDHLEDVSKLSFFILLSFADLKKHNYYYWFAFPALREPAFTKTNDSKTIGEEFSKQSLKTFTNKYFDMIAIGCPSMFIYHKSGEIYLLKDKINHRTKDVNFRSQNSDAFYFCYTDSSESPLAGWVLRQYIVYLVHTCPLLRSKLIKFISLRQDAQCIAKSFVYELMLPENDVDFENGDWVGWETNINGKFAPRLAEMGKSMDPLRLAESSVNLNLKLMKWRILPELNLNAIASSKCLLLGAGTLGCGVARTLLAWGVNTITFVDYGNVSFSNPVRQTLFLHEDALNGGNKKATAAATRLQQIHPGVTSTGFVMQIPMPGHPFGESLLEKSMEDLNKLKELIQDHDAIFLLTDSRESRWLPTLLGACHDKIVINAALGFDSYLIMRHGSRKQKQNNENTKAIQGLKCVSGKDLGCYFCNDVIAPGNSMKDRTLDQQCTVTRPAVSNIASGMAAELFVALLQHKERELAPAYFQSHGNSSSRQSSASIPEGLLGIIPHSIRGTLSTYEQIMPATEKFSQCIACSEKVLNEYKTRGNEFLVEVFESSKSLEDLTGISQFVEIDDMIECDDFDSE